MSSPHLLMDGMDAAERKVIEDVRDFGWHVMKVFEDRKGPGFAFTIGLPTTFHHPECIIIGLPPNTMHVMLNTLGESLRIGRRYQAGDETDILLEGYVCTFRPFPTMDAYLGTAIWYHQGHDFGALQVVWPDREHRYPWHPAVSEDFRKLQPVLQPPVVS